MLCVKLIIPTTIYIQILELPFLLIVKVDSHITNTTCYWVKIHFVYIVCLQALILRAFTWSQLQQLKMHSQWEVAIPPIGDGDYSVLCWHVKTSCRKQLVHYRMAITYESSPWFPLLTTIIYESLKWRFMLQPVFATLNYSQQWSRIALYFKMTNNIHMAICWAIYQLVLESIAANAFL